MSNFRTIDRRPASCCRRRWMNGCRKSIWRGRGGSDRRPRLVRDERQLSRLWVGVVSSSVAARILVYGYATGVFSSRKLERPAMTRWRFASLRLTIIPTTTRSLRSGGGF